MTERQMKAALNLHKAQVEFTAAFSEQANGTIRWLKLVTMVEDAGGTVTAAQWREMGLACGYDTRGLGGFYVGGNASMKKNDDNTRTLTPAGIALLDQHGRVH